MFPITLTGSGAHPPPIQWVPRDVSQRLKGQGPKADQLVPNLRMDQLYLHFPIPLNGVVR
jgi:hypothetical protein